MAHYYQENGFTSEWFYDQHRMRTDRLDEAAVRKIVVRHGFAARAELAMLANSGNFNSYVPILDALTPRAAKPSAATEPVIYVPHQADDLPLFAGKVA